MLAFVESYGPTRYIVQHLLARYGVTHTLLSIEDLAGIERRARRTRRGWCVFESPTNPVTKIADIEHLTAHARRAGCLTVMDNTFAGFHNHGGYDVDIFLHSLTKYASGHGDVMGGAIIARRELIAAMRKDVVSMGPTLDPHAAFLIQRGMRTYFLRYERQCANALAVSRFLQGHPRVKRVFYPGLRPHPQHELAKRQMSDFGGVVSFELDGGHEEANRFAEALEYFSIASSVGSTESLVMPPQLLGGQEYTRGAARGLAHRPGHGAAVDRHRGCRGSDRGPGAGLGPGIRHSTDPPLMGAAPNASAAQASPLRADVNEMSASAVVRGSPWVIESDRRSVVASQPVGAAVFVTTRWPRRSTSRRCRGSAQNSPR